MKLFYWYCGFVIAAFVLSLVAAGLFDLYQSKTSPGHQGGLATFVALAGPFAVLWFVALGWGVSILWRRFASGDTSISAMVLVFAIAVLLIVIRSPFDVYQNFSPQQGIKVKGDQVYLNGVHVEQADPATFAEFSMGYFKDKDMVYMPYRRINGVTASQFRKINQDPQDHGFRDDKHVVLWGEVLPDADPDTFRLIGSTIYRDATHLFWKGKLRPGIDVDSFKFLGLSYGKDKNHVYQFGSQGDDIDDELKKIESADPVSFELLVGAQGLTSVKPPELLNTPDAADKNHKFRNGQIIN